MGCTARRKNKPSIDLGVLESESNQLKSAQNLLLLFPQGQSNLFLLRAQIYDTVRVGYLAGLAASSTTGNMRPQSKLSITVSGPFGWLQKAPIGGAGLAS